MKKAKFYFEVGNSCRKAVRGEKRVEILLFFVSAHRTWIMVAQERKNSKEIVLEKSS